MSWAGAVLLRFRSAPIFLTCIVGRFQEKCQPGDDAGDDEDGYACHLSSGAFGSVERTADGSLIRIGAGHVEKTNDRDYEVEERYGQRSMIGACNPFLEPVADCGGGPSSCRRYRTMEGAANRLQKEARGYLDSLRGRTWLLSGSHDSQRERESQTGRGRERERR